MKPWSILLLVLWALGALLPARAEDVVLYAYHLKPPYIVDEAQRKGLYYDLAQELSKRVRGYTFRTEYLPRLRLERDLEKGTLKGLVVGVNPAWFKDLAHTRFLWSPPFMHDTDVVVSTPQHPLAYEGPQSLVGKKVGLSRGYYYFGVDELVADARVLRDDADGEEANLTKLLLGRVDAVIVTQRTLDYLQSHHSDWHNAFFVAPKPHDAYDRMVLIPREFAAVAAPLAAALGQLQQDARWRSRLKSANAW